MESIDWAAAIDDSWGTRNPMGEAFPAYTKKADGVNILVSQHRNGLAIVVGGSPACIHSCRCPPLIAGAASELVLRVNSLPFLGVDVGKLLCVKLEWGCGETFVASFAYDDARHRHMNFRSDEDDWLTDLFVPADFGDTINRLILGLAECRRDVLPDLEQSREES